MDNLPIDANQTLPQHYQEIAIPEPEITTLKYLNTCELAADLLGNGNSIRGTAALVGLHEDTVHYWLDNSSHFRALIEIKKVARREKLLGRIDKASEKNWFAAAWILERNKVFGGEFKQQAATNQGAAVNIQINVAHPGLVTHSGTQGENDSE
jgi:hypothetical protein